MNVIQHELPLWGQPTLGAQKNTPADVQTTIATRIESALGYTPTNELFIKFINEFGHPNQLKKCNSSSNTGAEKQKIIKEITEFESLFNQQFYYAACIAVQERKQEQPNFIGFNISDIKEAAYTIIEKGKEEKLSAREDIGYTK